MEQRHGDTAFLDGLRGIAAFAVVLSHLIFWFYPEGHIGTRAPSPSATALRLFDSPFSFFCKGGYAVAVFFVLSGFVLTRACLRKNNNIYTAQAALKRYVRLGGPVFATVLICAVMRALGLFPANEMGIKTFLSGAYGTPPDWIEALRAATYGAMLYGDRSYDYVLWTISIEFYGSLLVFACFALFGFNQKLLRGVTAALAVLFAIQMGNATYYFLFFAGSFFATMDWHHPRHNIVRTLLAPAALLLGLYLGGYAPGSTSYSIIGHTANDLQKQEILTLNWPILFYGVGAVLLIYAVLATRWTHKFLASPPLRWLGGISFSLYLLHSLILTASAPLVIKYMGFNLGAFLVALVVTSTLTFIASHGFWKMVDIPFTRLADRFGKMLCQGAGSLRNPNGDQQLATSR